MAETAEARRTRTTINANAFEILKGLPPLIVELPWVINKDVLKNNRV
jgi:hypothetical protein